MEITTEQQWTEWMRRYQEAINTRDLPALDRVVATLVTSDYVGHLPGNDSVRGARGLSQYMRGVVERNPGYTATMDDLFLAGDKAACRFTGHCVDPATGKAQHLMILTISRLLGAQSAEDWETIGSWQDDA